MLGCIEIKSATMETMGEEHQEERDISRRRVPQQQMQDTVGEKETIISAEVDSKRNTNQGPA